MLIILFSRLQGCGFLETNTDLAYCFLQRNNHKWVTQGSPSIEQAEHPVSALGVLLDRGGTELSSCLPHGDQHKGTQELATGENSRMGV